MLVSPSHVYVEEEAVDAGGQALPGFASDGSTVDPALAAISREATLLASLRNDHQPAAAAAQASSSFAGTPQLTIQVCS